MSTVLLTIGAGILLLVILISVLKFNAFLSMLLVSLLIALIALPAAEVVPALTTGFGNTMKSIGIIIILGSIIGILLEKTGATLSIAAAIVRMTGMKRAGLAAGMTGFITGIPIFCDSGFIVLSGVNRSLALRSGKPMVYMATLLAAGLYSVHCLIPPHPGAMAAAGIMKNSVGTQILAGLLVALPATFAGFAWARLMCRKEFRQPQPAGVSADAVLSTASAVVPPVWKSLLPVLVPLMLISIRSILLLYASSSPSILERILLMIGYPETALLVGIGLAMLLLPGTEIKKVNLFIEEAIQKAGPVLILTAAGGALGNVIRATGIGDEAGKYLPLAQWGLLVPFLIAVFLKTAQGSSTIAIMTAASIVFPLLPALHLDSENGRLLATLAMGAGSMAISYANDSFYWVVTKFSGINPSDAIRVYSTATLVMSLTAMAIVFGISLIVL